MEKTIIPKTNFKINLHKVINSVRDYKKDKRKRQDLEEIRLNKDLAHISKTFDEPEFAKYFEGKAKIIKDTKEK